MLDAVATPGEVPGDVEIRAPYPAGAALEATFIDHPDVVFVPDVDLCRAEDCAGLAFAFPANFHVGDLQVGVVVDAIPCCVEFVFYFAHFTDLHALHARPMSL